MVFFSPAVAGPRPSNASDDSVLTMSDMRCGSNVGASAGGAAIAGDSTSVIERDSSEAARRVMAYPWREPVRLVPMVAATAIAAHPVGAAHPRVQARRPVSADPEAASRGARAGTG